MLEHFIAHSQTFIVASPSGSVDQEVMSITQKKPKETLQNV